MNFNSPVLPTTAASSIGLLAGPRRVVMYGVGSYNLVKAHTFNGLPLPSIYALGAGGEVTMLKEFTLKEQSQKWGFEASACFGN